MPRHDNTRRLFAIMCEHELRSGDVADLLDCSIRTVYCWRAESPRPIPDRELERLELKLQMRRLAARVQFLEAKMQAPRTTFSNGGRDA